MERATDISTDAKAQADERVIEDPSLSPQFNVHAPIHRALFARPGTATVPAQRGHL
jgi:hypothetical protein